MEDGHGEDAKDNKATMETYWIPGINNLHTYGRWAFAEFTDVWGMESDFRQKVEAEFETAWRGQPSPKM